MTPTANPSQTLDFQCQCGAIKGAVTESTPPTGRRLVCHCNDCQAFAHYLGKEKRMLDDHAGTHVYQMDSAKFTLSQGQDKLACVTVTGGPLLRWYCNDCQTPIANTLSSTRFAFLSLILSAFDAGKTDAVLGREVEHVAIASGVGDLGQVRTASMPGMLWNLLVRTIKARFNPELKKSPLFDDATGEPLAVPIKLEPAQRLAIDEKADIYREVLGEAG
ncbi:DUF6151 family protein [Parasphingorhabdus cellanae]|uniref:CENP-V/GFA domain-containing protein n=1 Tax=Parasphingorhabdus cellanae TaxID=2806553 RepID=A0ABX7TAM5_9SPHN|nr:DUF6151 family protein [Parasphingorhabdus cellanae]QTD57570.1 hypothetical protein J4G78_08645 [Parasphingorhabdus cellanae]